MHIVRRHTIVHFVMTCTVFEGGEGHRILTKGTPTRVYQCKQQRYGVKDGVVPHYGFGISIQHQLQLAGCKVVVTGTLQAYTRSFNCQVAGK